MGCNDFPEAEYVRKGGTASEVTGEVELGGGGEHVLDIAQHGCEDISRLRILDAAEERDLAQRGQAGEHEAQDMLIAHNLRLVVHLARPYLGRGLTLLDLVEAGKQGLVHAIEKFDPARGARLSTDATWWIRQTIELALMKVSPALGPAAQVALPSQLFVADARSVRS